MKGLAEFARNNNAAQISVARHGQLQLSEQFTPLPVDVFAVQKGVLAILIGIAEEKYLLEISDLINHHLDPEWTLVGPWSEASLTIENLMTMTTGMDDQLRPLGEIGKSWRYNNVAYQYLKKILCLHTGLSLNELSRDWLFEPLAMHDSTWIDRKQRLADGTPFSGLSTTANDLVRLGEAIRLGGKPVLNDRYYLDALTKPGSAENPAWGLLWWNNHQASFRLPMMEERVFGGPPIPAAPPDLMMARGARGNHFGICPSIEMTVAVTINTAGEINSRFERELWEAISATL